MSLAYKRQWIIGDMRDGYRVPGIARRRGVSEEFVRSVLAEWSLARKRESTARSWQRRKKHYSPRA